MALRTKPPAAAAIERRSLVSLHQTDPNGEYVLEQSLWHITKKEDHAFLAHCESLGDSIWPKTIVDHFAALKTELSRPKEVYDNKHIEKHYELTLSYANDSILAMESENSESVSSDQVELDDEESAEQGERDDPIVTSEEESE